MSHRDDLYLFLDSIYTPRNRMGEMATLQKIVTENDYRNLDERDTKTMVPDCLIIITKGRGEWESFHRYLVTRIDIGEVNATYADIAYYDPDSAQFVPMRVKRDNIRINLPVK